MSFEKEKKVLKKVMIALDFEFDRQVKHGERWKNYEKGIFYQLSGSPSNNGWFDDARRQFQKLIQSNFDTVELNEKLKPLLRKNKVKFNKQGKIRVLRIEGDFETNLLRDLLIPEYNEEDEMDKDDEERCCKDDRESIMINTEENVMGNVNMIIEDISSEEIDKVLG